MVSVLKLYIGPWKSMPLIRRWPRNELKMLNSVVTKTSVMAISYRFVSIMVSP